jgi:hypothetical protein
MNLLKPLTLEWWQIGLFKLGLLALGVIIGATWHEAFSGATVVLAVIAAATLGYISYVWLRTRGA